MVMFSTNEHRKFFAEFCKWELASGGPDSQLPTVAEMATTAPNDLERIWRALCYIGVYNVPYGEVLWSHWTLEEADHNPHGLRNWLDSAFAAKKITTRIERRSARRADWMDGYLMGACRFVKYAWDPLKYKCSQAPTPEKAYEIAWDAVMMIPTVGRYAAIKLIEYLRRFEGLEVRTPDIRPKDAWSPRHTLGYIFPDRGLGNKNNSPEALKLAHQSCVDAISMLKNEYDVEIDMFQLQVLLCEYRESWESKKQYPGRSLDSELKYAALAQTEWEYFSDIWRARMKLFPHKHLGELKGWEGPRKNVAQCLHDHHYTWTDLVYDYNKTPNMAEPLRWVV